jgi:hypothetical protein
MTFDLNKFKEQVTEFVRTTNFRVIVDGDAALSFLIYAIEIQDTSVVLSLYEREDFFVFNQIAKWKEYQDKLPLSLEVFNEAGSLVKVLEGSCYATKKITSHTRLNWGMPNDLMKWDVTIPITWNRP